jgi:hypothetical protein
VLGIILQASAIAITAALPVLAGPSAVATVLLAAQEIHASATPAQPLLVAATLPVVTALSLPTGIATSPAVRHRSAHVYTAIRTTAFFATAVYARTSTLAEEVIRKPAFPLAAYGTPDASLASAAPTLAIETTVSSFQRTNRATTTAVEKILREVQAQTKATPLS